MPDALVLDSVTVQFGGLRAVDAVSTRIEPGERRAIIGPNGAGKTTLFNAMTGIVRPTSGSIRLGARDITRMAVHRRVRLGVSRTFQITNLFPRLTVMENMRLALRGLLASRYALFAADRLDAVQQRRAAGALDQVRLSGRAGTLVADLSYGEQRQLELAMSLVTDPAVLLLDEPAAGLSPAERGIVTDIVRSLPRSLTVVLIEHDMDLVMNLVDRITCLENGRLLVEGDPEAVRADARVQAVYLGTAHA